jgi:hypothetical protein
MTGNYLLVLVDQDWGIEAKCVDAFGDGPNLPARVFARIARVRSEHRYGEDRKLTGQGRRSLAAMRTLLRWLLCPGLACTSHLEDPFTANTRAKLSENQGKRYGDKLGGVWAQLFSVSCQILDPTRVFDTVTSNLLSQRLGGRRLRSFEMIAPASAGVCPPALCRTA